MIQNRGWRDGQPKAPCASHGLAIIDEHYFRLQLQRQSDHLAFAGVKAVLEFIELPGLGSPLRSNTNPTLSCTADGLLHWTPAVRHNFLKDRGWNQNLAK
ncbi:MAG: hypothetical protein ACRD8O_13920, partial [Bryobacteraceae bacterium]